jgi:hypothetical protein
MANFFAAARQSKTFVSLRILTDSGWLSGMYLKLASRQLADSLNQGGDTVVLTNAFVPSGENEIPFLSVRRDKMVLIMPDEIEAPNQESGIFVAATPRKVVMLAGLASIAGTISVPSNLRVTDYFSRNHGFIVVTKLRLTVRNPEGGDQWTRDLEQILVRGDSMVAVSEVESSPTKTSQSFE